MDPRTGPDQQLKEELGVDQTSSVDRPGKACIVTHSLTTYRLRVPRASPNSHKRGRKKRIERASASAERLAEAVRQRSSSNASFDHDRSDASRTAGRQNQRRQQRE